MAIRPPEARIWWNEPLHWPEIVWISIAFVWGLVMFLAMIYWHVEGEQNLSNEAYRTTPQAFAQKTQEMTEQYTVREEEGKDGVKVPVVHPPPDSDVYLIARLWQWWPILELEKDKSYRLHISSLDWQHGFSLQPVNINLQIHPGYDMVLTVRPNEAGEFSVVCNEFCGIGHHNMIGKMYVVE